jgi:hypothetical protein
MKELILEKIKVLEAKVEKLNEAYGEEWEEFNAMDASGGNFDDAYELGSEHGEIFGKLSLLRELLKTIQD